MVEQPSDVIPIERSGEFQGRYHVLGGALSPIDGVDPEDLQDPELLGRVDNGGVIREVVIATNATTTGEATAPYRRTPCASASRRRRDAPRERSARGSDLEYADEIFGAAARPAGDLAVLGAALAGDRDRAGTGRPAAGGCRGRTRSARVEAGARAARPRPRRPLGRVALVHCRGPARSRAATAQIARAVERLWALNAERIGSRRRRSNP